MKLLSTHKIIDNITFQDPRMSCSCSKNK